MSTRAAFLLSFLILFFSCKKKNEAEPPSVDAPPIVVVDDLPACESIPPAPAPFGWQDSTADPSQNILAYNYNPLNPDEFIYLLDGDISIYHPLLKYNVISKQKTELGHIGSYAPSINSKGWITYSSVDNNIFKVKINGDSLVQITFNFISLAAQWDYQGKGIYFFQQANQNLGNQIAKLDASGNLVINLFPADLPQFAVFHKSDQILFCKTSGSLVTVFQRKIGTEPEIPLVTGPYNAQSGVSNFNNLCIDLKDENFFWSNTLGIFRCNIATLKVDTLFKNCESRIFDYPQVSAHNNELTMTMHLKKVLGSYQLFHEYRAMNVDLDQVKATEVKLFQ